jgi:3-oxoacyl-[acyl-carrier protein] reductase
MVEWMSKRNEFRWRNKSRKHLSDLFGPKGIRVNNVAPGYTKTESLKALMQKRAKDLSGEVTEKALSDIEQRWTANIPLRRLASPEEIASACIYLFSENASFITGQTLTVDGGMTRGY